MPWKRVEADGATDPCAVRRGLGAGNRARQADKYNGKLLMKPSKANVKAHLDKIREVIKANKAAKQANLIRLLNPVLRGWANYHSHVVAKETFTRVDARVWSMLWRWAVRRHPNKGARWVKEKYFKTRGTRNCVFIAIEKH